MDKALVRWVLNSHRRLKNQILNDPKAEGIVTSENYEEVSMKLMSLQTNERAGQDSIHANKSHTVRLDYAATIDKMLEDLLLRIMLEQCLYAYLQKLEQKAVPRVKNYKIYTTTVNEYLNYINSLNSEIEK